MSGSTWIDSTPTNPTPTAPPVPEPVAVSATGVWPPLAGLVADGTLTPAQAEAVRSTLQAAPAKPHRGRLIAEVGMYLGAALVLLGLMLYVGSQWSQLNVWGRSGILIGTAIVCIAVAVIIVAASTATWATLREPAHAATRRLTSVLLTVSAAALGGALAAFIANASRYDQGAPEVLSQRPAYFLPLAAAAAVAFALLVVVRWLAPTPFSDLAWFGSALLVTGLFSAAWLLEGETVMMCVGAMALAWAIVAATTRVIYVRELGLALGMGVAAFTAVTFSAVGAVWHWAPLVVILVGSIVAYVMTARWQFLMAAAISTVGGASTFADRVVHNGPAGFALVAIAAGLILVSLGALAFVVTAQRRKRRERAAATQPPTVSV